MTHLQAVKEAIIRFSPSVKSTNHISLGGNLRCKNCGEPDNFDTHGTCKKGEERPIKLDDVLLALTDKFIIGLGDGEVDLCMGDIGLYDKTSKIGFSWTLNKNLDWHAEHKPQVIEKLHSLLVTNK